MKQLFRDPKDLSRFYSKVSEDPETGCWNWVGWKTSMGRGGFNAKGDKWNAHVYLFIYLKGEIPDNRELDHLCRNILCVNPDHLEVVDHPTNILRGEIFNRNKTHCKRGHEFTKENTYLCTRYGGVTFRNCKTCKLSYRERRGLRK